MSESSEASDEPSYIKNLKNAIENNADIADIINKLSLLVDSTAIQDMIQETRSRSPSLSAEDVDAAEVLGAMPGERTSLSDRDLLDIVGIIRRAFTEPDTEQPQIRADSKFNVRPDSVKSLLKIHSFLSSH